MSEVKVAEPVVETAGLPEQADVDALMQPMGKLFHILKEKALAPLDKLGIGISWCGIMGPVTGTIRSEHQDNVCDKCRAAYLASNVAKGGA